MIQQQMQFPAISPLLDELISEARKSKDLSACARAVLDVLADPCSPHIGRASAISIAEMQDRWIFWRGHAWTERQIKSSVKELIEDHLIRIGSSRNEPYGYYLCQSDDDIRAATAPYVSQIKSELKRLRIFGVSTDYVRHLLGQEELG